MQERVLSLRKAVLDEVQFPNGHLYNSSNNHHHKVAIKDEGVVVKDKENRVLTKDRLDNHKEEEGGVQGEEGPLPVDHNHNVVAWLPSSIRLDHFNRLQEDLHQFSVVEVMSMVVLDLPRHQLPSCTKLHRLPWKQSLPWKRSLNSCQCRRHLLPASH